MEGKVIVINEGRTKFDKNLAIFTVVSIVVGSIGAVVLALILR